MKFSDSCRWCARYLQCKLQWLDCHILQLFLTILSLLFLVNKRTPFKMGGINRPIINCIDDRWYCHHEALYWHVYSLLPIYVHYFVEWYIVVGSPDIFGMYYSLSDIDCCSRAAFRVPCCYSSHLSRLDHNIRIDT